MSTPKGFEPIYTTKEVTAKKNGYCAGCKSQILKGQKKYLIYVEYEWQREHHYGDEKDENGEKIGEYYHIINNETLIGVCHQDCINTFIEKNKQEHEEKTRLK